MIDLAGKALTGVELDDASILHLTIDGGWLLSVENDYELVTAEGRHRTLDEAETLMVSALTGQVGRLVRTFAIEGDGSLVVTVGDVGLSVPASSDYESWNLVGPDRVLVVSMPGGQLATWGVA
ncbi:DUF6188 family protein [Nocardioides campestrisoli]|uniref:DUF6188 family protein n=1 Tax=Nocardioides campestrisoli TaxID=2736757 RepID=UPI0015E6808E|nr:DUF6188 family protein [Nocardioides campestrisoli]